MSKGFFFTFSQSIGWFTKLVPRGNPEINFWCFLSVSMNHRQPLWYQTHPAKNYNSKIHWHKVSDLQRCPILLPKWYCNTILPKYTIILNLSSNSNCSEWFTKVSIGHCPILWPKLYCNTFKIIAACPNYYYSKLIFKFKCSYVASIHPPL